MLPQLTEYLNVSYQTYADDTQLYISMSSHNYNPVRQHCINNSASEKQPCLSSFPDDKLLLGINSRSHLGTVESELPGGWWEESNKEWPGQKKCHIFNAGSFQTFVGDQRSKHYGFSNSKSDLSVFIRSAKEVFSWRGRRDCIWPQKCKVKGQHSLGFSQCQ